MNLAENIYRFRTKQNMSQMDLADALDVSRQSVSKWETGTAVPELEKLMKMSDLFGVSLDALVGHESALPDMPELEPENNLPSNTVRGYTMEDAISMLILLFGILIPVIIISTEGIHHSTLLMALGLLLIPPLATIFASFLSPKNNLIFWIYVVYDVIFGILSVVAASVLAPFVGILYIFVIGLWNDARS